MQGVYDFESGCLWLFRAPRIAIIDRSVASAFGDGFLGASLGEGIMMDQTRDGVAPAAPVASGLTYRLLKIFTDVKPGEVGTALLLTLNVFLLLMCYYFIKPVREGLILTQWSGQFRSYLAAAQAILFIFMVKGFSRLASRVPRHLLITWVTLFFISNLGIFALLFIAGLNMKALAIAFFIWVGIFNLIIVAQFWSFANDIYTEEEGKRLFPMIAVGSSLGALFGTQITNIVIKPLGRHFHIGLMLMTAAVLGLCILMTIVIHKREIRRLETKTAIIDPKALEEARIKAQPLKKGGGFRLVFKSRYLLFYALMLFCLNYVNFMGETIWGISLKKFAAKAFQLGATGGLDVAQYTTAVTTKYQFLYNLIALIIQMFLVSRIFKWFGVSGAVLILPLIALGGYGLIGVGATSLIFIKWVKGFENGLDYSLMNTTKGALFLVTSREEKYKGKAAADTFFYRSGDALAGVTVFLGTAVGFAVQRYAKVNVLVIVAWIVLALLVIREYKKLKAKSATAVT
jgi:AAA family ATP:ADP antiporter